MMIFIGYLEKNAFFEFLVAEIIKFVGKGERLIYVILFLSAFFAAIVDEVTSILFMLSIVLSICSKLRLNPVPFVLMVVFATNIGSSATAIGNPVGVMIALNAKLGFSDFLVHATPISFIVLLLMMLLVSFVFKKDIKEFSNRINQLSINEIFEEHLVGTNKIFNALFFLIVFSMLVFHTQIEHFLSVEKNSMMLGTSFAAAGIVLLLDKKNAKNIVETKVDWWTLFFFMLLFASIGALEETGVMEIAAKSFGSFFSSNKFLLVSAILLLSGLLSAVLDNVLAVAIFIPLIHDLQINSFGGEYLWWSLLFGATLFGNLTMVGSTANIIALGILDKRGLPKISFMEWLKIGALITIPTAFLALLLIFFQYLI
jgi:Na+/H+ antiporter NhaD/arsenite permease-like protein